MTREQITAVLLQRADTLKGMGATGLFMFGSRARGDHGPNSDLDLFYDLDETRVKSYLDFIGFGLDLEETLGIPIHMAARDDFDRSIMSMVEQHAIRIF